MTSDTFLHGNSPSDLVRVAAETGTGTGAGGWEPPAPEVLQAMLPGYVILQFLARGGMGAVYRGEQASLGRAVAIKILPPQLREADANYAQRFKQEARAMARLNHPGIVSVYDFGEMPDGTLYLVMEFIDGTDVGQTVAWHGRLPSAHAMAIAAHVCDALQYAHDHGVVHRDIKPANIMVGHDGRVKVADFGLARSAHQQDPRLTVSGHVMGTPHFVAPEALTMGVHVDHRADIYAAGVMLYQMLTGRLPQGIFEMPSLQVPGLDPRYDTIVSNAMRDDRERRYQNIHEMRRALDDIVTHPVAQIPAYSAPTVVAAAPPRRGPPPAASRRSSPPPASVPVAGGGGWGKAGIFVGLMAAVAAGGYLFFARPAPSSPPPVVVGQPQTPAAPPPASKAASPAPPPAQESKAAVRKPAPSAPQALTQSERQGRLVIPSMQFTDGTLLEAVEFLRQKATELDPQHQPVHISIDPAVQADHARLNLDAGAMTLLAALEHLGEYYRAEVHVRQDFFELRRN